MNNIKENIVISVLETTGSPRSGPLDRSAGANECAPNPVLKIKTSRTYDTTLFSEWLGIVYCYIWLHPCPALGQPELRRDI